MIAVHRSSRCLLVVSFAAVTLCSANRSDARIGETTLQCVARYGPPKATPSSKFMDKYSPLLEGAIAYIYEYKGRKSSAPFLQLSGPAVRSASCKMTVAAGRAFVRRYD